MDRISCLECKQCNRKGKPSVTRFSKYCDLNYRRKYKIKRNWFSWFTNIKNKFIEKRYDENKRDINSKGFRKDWFLR